MYMHKNHCHRATAHLQLNILLLLYMFSRNVYTYIYIYQCADKSLARPGRKQTAPVKSVMGRGMD